MPAYSRKSKERLETCEQDIQDIMNEVVKEYDNSILEGHRGEVKQNKYFANGTSRVEWPNGKHNSYPSKAIDAAPYPIDWGEDGDRATREKAIWRFIHFAGYVQAVALHKFGVKLRYGGDWDSDKLFDDQSFYDLVHFEIVD